MMMKYALKTDFGTTILAIVNDPENKNWRVLDMTSGNLWPENFRSSDHAVSTMLEKCTNLSQDRAILIPEF